MKRLRLTVHGQVQGVGFRPFVYRIATECGLTGFTGNNSQGVFIEIQGTPDQLELFQSRFKAEVPPLAVIDQVDIAKTEALQEQAFTILASQAGGSRTAGITPDSATCEDCLAELDDPDDRRYRYPFINCTNCGPRYSIIEDIPYDRPKTTMATFTMCDECQAEYDDPLDRRFHAQPNACPRCGPHLWLVDNQGRSVEGDAIKTAAEMLHEGRILAVKGLGGFHLACLAGNEEAVQSLRTRKHREAKPLAVMVRNLGQAHGIAEIDAASAALLSQKQRPIVLVPRKKGAAIAPSVAPDTTDLGLILPYTPVHELLLADTGCPLVMTSGNPSGEPLCTDNDEALQRLATAADAFLLHDRPIRHAVDDSVIMPLAVADAIDHIPVRRARGFVPEPIRTTHDSLPSVLALGGELKSTVCLFQGGKAVVSEHLGELTNAAAFRNFTAVTNDILNLFEGDPQVIACDLHPDYPSSRHATSLNLPVERIQHHHAHIASCMAEHNHSEPVIGIAADGTGYGSDGAIWGCEFMVCDYHDFVRSGHLQYFPLPGGDAAARFPWRPAASLLTTLFPGKRLSSLNRRFADVGAEALHAVSAMARHKNTVHTSSLGRLFDAAAFLLGLAAENRYEAEAAIRLEQAAMQCSSPYLIKPEFTTNDKGLHILSPQPVFERFLSEPGRPAAEHAAAFHTYLANSFLEAAQKIRLETHISTVVLSGGCFLNRILLLNCHQLLLEHGFTVLMHRTVPPGDGGISLGQAMIAAHRNLHGSRHLL